MKTKYTPALIANDTVRFSIPLYQRLFEWQETEIIQLLKDLKIAYKKTPDQPYYIGMLTVFNQDSRFDLVDGQQRFTVLMLMAIVFDWKNFRTVGGGMRLSFFARKKDERYLQAKINGESPNEYINAKMDFGINCIKDFVAKLGVGNETEFKNYIYNNLTFFISYLPSEYKLHDLNRYFEAMNATGRGLENHEILKVNLLRELNINDQEKYTRIWNAVADMDKPLIRQRHDNETIEVFRNRQNRSLLCLSNQVELITYCNFNLNINIKHSEIIADEFQTIRNINPVKVAPSTQYRAVGERAILSFPEFLLLVLSLQINGKETPDFFNIHKLQETFKSNLESEDAELFFRNLLKYRILFDYFIIKISNNDQNSSNYTLAFKEDLAESDDRERLIKYQSMLYVSTSWNIWISKALKCLEVDSSAVDSFSFLKALVDFDNERKKDINSISLKYGEIDRYWFWRLDFYLWEKELQKSKDRNKVEKELQKTKVRHKAILEYSFKANRSIEHLHPRTSATEWDSDNLNSFGNLAMISPSFNSTQSNDYENVKFARIENQISGKYLLESIKMLLMYQKAEVNSFNWNIDLAKEHGNEMIDILIDSFEDNEEYKNIREKLADQKYAE